MTAEDSMGEPLSGVELMDTEAATDSAAVPRELRKPIVQEPTTKKNLDDFSE